MANELTDLIFNACAAVAMIGLTITIAFFAIVFLVMFWKLATSND
jgi:hypothetical protein